MNILYITASDPFDPTSGSRQRSAFLYQALKAMGEVEVVNPLIYGEGTWIRKLFAIPFRKLTKVARWPVRRHLVKGQYDAVVVRYLFAAAEMQAWQYGPCFVDIDDIPVDAFDNVDGGRIPRILRPLARLIVVLWQKYCINHCAGVWIVTSAAKSVVRHENLGVLPNLARRPDRDYSERTRQKRQLMTVGLMGYAPNSAGVDWFIENVWKKVVEKYPDMKYVVAGGELSESYRIKWSKVKGVRVAGFVDDIDALYAESLAVVAPILTGAGTCIKVVEAGLHGRIVFATPNALRGHDQLLSTGGVRRFSTAEEFIAQFDDLLRIDLDGVQAIIRRKTESINSFEAFETIVRNMIQK